MTPHVHPHGLPFGCPRCAVSGLMLKTELGEAPEHPPALQDVHQKRLPPATSLDGGPIDRIVTELAGGLRAARLHSAAASTSQPGARHMGYDATEQATGVARTFYLRVPPGAPIAALCDRLAQISTVEAVSPNYLATAPFDMEIAPAPAGPRPDTARDLIRLSQALAIEPGDPAVLVGLIDSGVTRDHPELLGRLRAGYDFVRLQPRDIGPGMSLVGDHRQDDNDPTDHFVGHGMACAGIIGAAGYEIEQGCAGDTRIVPMRALGAVQIPGKGVPVGLGAISDLDMALKLCIDLGARIINLSFGTDDRALHPSSPRPHRDLIDYAIARGCILIAASGNNGDETRYWPAAYPEVIAVGAVEDDGRVASFTTRGPHLDICAPGERVLTTGIAGYQYATGTSFAAPFVAGTAALLVSYAARHALALDTAAVRRLLTASARPFATPASGAGAGILDAAAALVRLQAEITQARASPGEPTDDF